MSEISGSPHVRKYTEEFRLAERVRAKGSLFYFSVAHLGFNRLSDIHYELCSFLEGRPPYHPWLRALVCAYRGSYKSTLCSQAYPVWRGIHIDSFSAKLIESNYDNAKFNHFVPIIDIFTAGPRAAYLQWMYADRLPENLKGWNTRQLEFVKTNPLASPAFSYWGMESRKEGWHGNLIIGDDLEGADAEESDVPSRLAWRTIAQCTPLLEEPATDQVLILGTPWGKGPLVWKIRDQEFSGAIDQETQKKRIWQIFWRPIFDEKGEPWEPKRFPPNAIKTLSKEELWETQFLLLKKRDKDQIFRQVDIEEHSFEYSDPERTIIRYQTFNYDIDKLTEEGYVIPEPETARINISQLRTYLHCDPTHKLHEEMKHAKKSRPSKHALIVVGIAPDGHAFPLEIWSKKCGLTEFTVKMMQLARKWNVFKMTYESIGAQIWLPKFVELYEKNQRIFMAQQMKAGNTPGFQHRSFSSMMEECNKGNDSKEWIFRQLLEPWVGHGILHLHLIYHHELIQQMLNIEDETQEIDIVDALSQGPEVWKPPIIAGVHAQLMSGRRQHAAMASRSRMVGHSPFARPSGY